MANNPWDISFFLQAPQLPTFGQIPSGNPWRIHMSDAALQMQQYAPTASSPTVDNTPVISSAGVGETGATKEADKWNTANTIGAVSLLGGALYSALGNGGGYDAIQEQREIVRGIKERLNKVIQERFSAATPEATALKTNITARQKATENQIEEDIARRGLTGYGVDVSKEVASQAVQAEGQGMAQLSSDFNQRRQQLIGILSQELGVSQQTLAQMIAEREAARARGQGQLAAGLANIGSTLILGV